MRTIALTRDGESVPVEVDGEMWPEDATLRLVEGEWCDGEHRTPTMGNERLPFETSPVLDNVYR